jgi:hypothetical protein
VNRIALERFRTKWKPVRVKKTRQIKNLEPRFDSIETEKALASMQSAIVIERSDGIPACARLNDCLPIG